MKRIGMLMLIIAAMLAAVPTHAFAKEGAMGGLEPLMDAMQKGDPAAAQAALTDDAALTLPAAMLPLDSPLRAQAAGPTLVLVGREQIAAWLDEFIGRDHGQITINGVVNGDAA